MWLIAPPHLSTKRTLLKMSVLQYRSGFPMHEETKQLPPLLEEEISEEETPVRTIWRQIVDDSYKQLVLFFEHLNTTIELITSKAHVIFILYGLFVSFLFGLITLYISVVLAVCAAIGVNLFQWLV